MNVVTKVSQQKRWNRGIAENNKSNEWSALKKFKCELNMDLAAKYDVFQEYA